MINNIKPTYYFIIIYLLSNAILLINGGVFWDDWTVFNMSFEGLEIQFVGNGAPAVAYLHYFLNQLPNPPFVYHFLVVVLQIATILLTWSIIKQINLQGKFFFWVIALISASPFFSAKITMICFPYILCYFLFFLAFWFGQRYIANNKIMYRIVALFLFFISFITNSLLVYYVLPFLILFMQMGKFDFSAPSWRSGWATVSVKNILRTLDFIILPFVFWCIKSIFMQPSGLYAKGNYNSIFIDRGFLSSLYHGIGNSVIKIPKVMIDNILENNLLILFLVITILVYLLLKRVTLDKFSHVISKDNSFYWLMLFIGGGLVVFAILPYAVVHKIPTFNGYSTRFQLLLPVGVCLSIISICFILIPKTLRTAIIVLILSSFITFNIHVNLQYIAQWIKQDAIIDHFKERNFEQDTIIFSDDLKEFGIIEPFRFYELTGMSKYANHNESNLIVTQDTYDRHNSSDALYSWNDVMEKATGYNITDYKLSQPTCYMDIQRGEQSLSYLLTLKLVYLRVADFQYFVNKFTPPVSQNQGVE